MKPLLNHGKQHFYRFSEKRADKVNSWITWGLIPLITAVFVLSPAAWNEPLSWWLAFASKQAGLMTITFICYYTFKGTRHSGITTFVLILVVYELVSLIIQEKSLVFDLFFKLMLLAVFLAHAFNFYQRTPKTNKNEE